MRITKIAHPLPGFYRIDTLVKRISEENEQDHIYAGELLRRARGAILANKLKSRDPETGCPISNSNDVSPIVTITDLNNWLGSWQCPFSLRETDKSGTEAAIATAPMVQARASKKNESTKTQAYNAEVHRQMTLAWNKRSPGTDPNKQDLHVVVYKEMLLGAIKPQRAIHSINTVREAAKKWSKEEAVAAQNLPAKPPANLPSKTPEQAGSTRPHWKDSRYTP